MIKDLTTAQMICYSFSTICLVKVFLGLLLHPLNIRFFRKLTFSGIVGWPLAMGCYFLGCPVIAVAAAAVTFALWCVKCLIMYDLYAETEHDLHMEFLEWEKDGKQEEEQTQAA